MKDFDSQKGLLRAAWKVALHKVDALIHDLKDQTPHYTQDGKWVTLSPALTAGLRAGKWDHGNWTGGFWAGILWLAYRFTGKDMYKQQARLWAEKFSFRKTDENTHDLGFIFFPSHILGYQLGSEQGLRAAAIAAAYTLLKRYSKTAGLLQAWGPIGHPELGGSSAIDTMMNLPLLWWAAKETGDEQLYQAAYRHALTSSKEYLRADGSTFHVVYFDRDTGKIVDRTTFQGYAKDSCWSRGQAWGIAGWATAYRSTGDERFLQAAERALDYYWQHLPDDKVPFWDFDDPRIPNTTRDSSAAAITAYGLIELAESHPDLSKREFYIDRAVETLESMARNYLNPDHSLEPGIVWHACYSKPHNQGVDSAVIWGDYFFLYNLLRV